MKWAREKRREKIRTEERNIEQGASGRGREGRGGGGRGGKEEVAIGQRVQSECWKQSSKGKGPVVLAGSRDRVGRRRSGLSVGRVAG